MVYFMVPAYLERLREKHKRPQSGQQDSGPSIEPRTFKMQNVCVEHYTKTLCSHLLITLHVEVNSLVRFFSSSKLHYHKYD
jgi:hypothetical protein